MAAMFAGAFLVVTVLLVAPYASYLPNAAMAGILFLVAWRLIDLHHIFYILKSSWSETSVLAVTFFGALFLELEFAIFAGVMLSLVLYLNRTSNPAVHTRVPDPKHPKRQFTTDPGLPECPQMKIVRVDGSLFFGAVPNVQRALRALRERAPEQKFLMVLATVTNIAPLIGFFGTVVGMILSFDVIAEHGLNNPGLVAKGISVALLTTAYGLIVAFVTQPFYNYFVGKISAYTRSMETVSNILFETFDEMERMKHTA